MGIRVWKFGIVLLVFIWVRLTCAAEPTSCPTDSVTDAIFGFRYSNCPVNGGARSVDSIGVIEGDEASLERALNMVDKNSDEYVAVLFYASWCPFSRMFKPTYSILASLYPSIPHFAFEESAIKPIILSKYGVHGFPAFFILNSTMCVRYQGSRTPGPLMAFYSDATGMKTLSLDQLSLEKIRSPLNHKKYGSSDQESSLFLWARSPENLLRNEKYLALASTFVLLRFLYLFFPTLLSFAQCAWRRYVRNVRLGSLLEHPLAFLNRAVQLFNSLKEPCKRSNLQGGAMNARVWASKSLATVSIGEASTIRGYSSD